jgi:drug/metabolite transporter (DMT)-like permease
VEVLLGGLSSLLYGVADFLGGEGAKRVPAAAIVLWAGVISFPIVLIVALMIGGEVSPTDLLLGVGAGACGAIGLVLLFAGLSRGHAAAVAPAAGAMAAVLPVLVAVVDGERPSPLAWAGVALAVPAIVLSSWVADPGEVVRESLSFGLFAGLGFGGFTAVIRFTDPDSNLLPLAAARAATLLVVLCLAGLGIWKLVGFRSAPKPLVLGNGLFDVGANVTLLLAVRSGSLALAAVASSFYPVVTVVMSRLVNSEHLRKRQIAGLGLTVVSMMAIAAG